MSTRTARGPARHCAARHRVAQRRRIPAPVWQLAIVLAVALTVSVIAMAGRAERGRPVAAEFRWIAADTFSRTVADGLGDAATGGHYSLRARAGLNAQVDGTAAVLSGVAPASFAEAWLPAVSGKDVDVRVRFRVPALPAAGSGVFLGVDLRKQANGDTLRARLRIDPRGIMYLGFSRVRKDVERAVGGQRRLGLHLTEGSLVVLEGAVTGDDVTTLVSRAWLASGATPSWQHRARDAGTGRIATAGGVGVWTYLTGRAAHPATVTIDSLDAFELRDDGGSTPLPPIGSLPPSAGPTSPHSSPASSSGSSSGSASGTAKPSGSSGSSGSSGTTSSAGSVSPSGTHPVTPPPPVPPSSGGVGSATVGSTDYTFGANAIFVSIKGNDTATGRIGSPLRSVAKAVSIAGSGDTIVMRGGTYHEDVVVPARKRLTIQSYPNEAVWFDGSSAVSDWHREGNVWVRSNWSVQFDSSPSFSRGGNSGFVNPAHPMAAHPDQVWIGGNRLTQVSSAAAVRSGSFYVDYRTNRLVVADDPAAGARASTLSQALTVYSGGTRLRGFGVRGYATSASELGSVLLAGVGDVAENIVVSQSATVGLTSAATDQVISKVTLVDNGLLGYLANYADRLRVTSMLSRHNNTEEFNTAPVAGGAKITRSRDVVVRDGVYEANLATGLWIDESCYDVTITGNRLIDNAKHGLSWELGAVGVIADNVVTGNTRYGMKINDVTHVQIWNNTFTGNGTELILVQDQRRASNRGVPGHDPRQTFPDPTMTWLLGDIDLHNNLFIRPEGSEVIAMDATRKRSATQMSIAVDGNAFTGVGGERFLWSRDAGATARYRTVAALEAGESGVGTSNGESIASTSALALPARIAAAVDRSAGIRHIGAF